MPKFEVTDGGMFEAKVILHADHHKTPTCAAEYAHSIIYQGSQDMAQFVADACNLLARRRPIPANA